LQYVLENHRIGSVSADGLIENCNFLILDGKGDVERGCAESFAVASRASLNWLNLTSYDTRSVVVLVHYDHLDDKNHVLDSFCDRRVDVCMPVGTATSWDSSSFWRNSS
jgi:hypothetical protein